MSVRPRSGVAGVSAFVFAVVLGSLAALRAWSLEPPTAVQSLVVSTGAVSVVTGVTAYVIRGENIGTRAGEGIVPASDPCLGFAANLLVPVPTMESPLQVAYPLAAGTTPVLAAGEVGAAVGYIIRVVRKNGTTIGRAS